MNPARPQFFLALILPLLCQAADLPPYKTTEIPASAKRPVVIELSKAEPAKTAPALPKADLPPGFTLAIAVAPPLVTHPIAGCLDDRGRLFLCDAVGVNWNKAQLEANPPNRVLMLEDTNKDGFYEKSTIFADRMTFPQGAQWLDGSLYVASPPGILKLTDADGDGVAEKREMIVTGFDYTGNAADVHGPFLHPNGRLYWCHGRKGYKVPGKEGDIIHEGKSSGIWSAKPDGSDVQWHSLLAGDNPVEVDFTPEGDIIGVQNLYYSQPRGDTIVHWLYGGVYERADQMKVIEGLPRTLETMPVMYNFGHVAVSGCCFWQSADALFRSTDGKPLQFMVTHFNTQRVVRMELTRNGSTYKAVENEFLKIHNPDIHITDVMEDADGSLLVLDTGGWFRIGCPSSLMAKTDVLGAVYRVIPDMKAERPAAPPLATLERDLKSQITDLKSPDAHIRRHTLEWLAQNFDEDWERDETADTLPEKLGAQIREMMREYMDAVMEHSLLLAAQKMNLLAVSSEDLKAEKNKRALQRMLMSFQADDGSSANLAMTIAREHLDSDDGALARIALKQVTDHPDADEWVAPELSKWLDGKEVSANKVTALEGFCSALITKPETQKMLAGMLGHESADIQSAALRVIASQRETAAHEIWIAPIGRMFSSDNVPKPLVMDAIKKLKSPGFDPALKTFASDSKQPQSLRLKALDAMSKRQLEGETLDMVRGVLADASSSSAAKIQAAGMIASAPLKKDQHLALAPLFSTIGPVELKTLLPLVRRSKDSDVARAVASQVARNPVIAGLQESLYRTAFSDLPTDIFETIIHPAYAKAAETSEAKKRLLRPLSEKVASQGKADAGRKHFETGKGTCIACHKIGSIGRPIGPDLSKIGAIRTERDLIESILFPSNTLARDYEAHVIEMKGGETVTGVIRSHTAEGLLVADIAGQEKNLPHQQIISDTTLDTSLMPMGLDQTMPEQELLDLVAYLRSLK